MVLLTMLNSAGFCHKVESATIYVTRAEEIGKTTVERNVAVGHLTPKRKEQRTQVRCSLNCTAMNVLTD